MEASEYGLTHGTCFVARRLGMVAVAGLLCISWGVLGGADFFVFFPILFFPSNAHGLCTMRPACLIYLSPTNFHKPGIYGSVQVWANAWDMFSRMPSRGCRGRRAAVDFVVYFGCGGIYFVFLFFLRTHTACCKYEDALPHLPL